MRKILMLLSVLALIVALGGPLLVGMQLEKTTLESREQLTSGLPPWVELIGLDYERGWFGAVSEYRFLVSDNAPPQVKQLIGAFGGFGDQPSLIVANAIQHGPLVGFLRPAIAKAESVFALDTGSNGVIQLPAQTMTHIGLTGTLQVDWRAAGASMVNENGQAIRWADLEGRLSVRPDLSEIHAEIRTPMLQAITPEGATALDIEGLDLSAQTETGSANTALQVDYTFRNRIAESAQMIAGDFALENLNNAALPGLHRMIDEARTRVAPITPRDLVAAHLTTLQTALSNTPEIVWQQSQIGDAGAIESDLAVTLAPARQPATNDIDAFTDHLVTDMQATLNISAPIASVEDLAATSNLVTTVRGMGMLEKDAEAGLYKMRMTYADGTAIVNGLPVPVMPKNR
ncbi:MAG: DUF945 family protein [Pseudomonadota bacterium]